MGFSSFLIDIDGVIIRGKTVLPGVPKFLTWMSDRHINHAYITNNSRNSSSEISRQLAGLGLSIPGEKIITGAEVTAQIVGDTWPGQNVYVVGPDSLAAIFEGYGVRAVQTVEDSEVAAVIVGLDFELTYQRLADAAVAISKGAAFVAVNRDKGLPVEDRILPGTGAIVAALEVCTGRKPEVIGKPKPTMLIHAMEKFGMNPSETMMIGDTFHADIVAGYSAGVKTALVTTGNINVEEMNGSHIQPDYKVQDLAELIEILN